MNKEVLISTDQTKMDIKMIHSYLSEQSYWAEGRSYATVKKSMEHSLCFGAFLGGKQVGFARVISDYAIFAWILDVFVLPEFGGKGIGKALMRHIMEHGQLQGLQRWGLATKDAHGLYEKFGFGPPVRPSSLMEINHIHI